MNRYGEESQAVQSHLYILQNVIQRMAANSAASKAWCITLVSAILVIVADKLKPDYALIALIPTVLFLVLDAYYLGLELGFRNSYNSFIEKLHNNRVEQSDLYAVKPNGKKILLFLKSLLSFSVWPFYTTLFVMIYLSKCFLL